MSHSNPTITVVLNQYKRGNLLRQLSRIEKQSCRIDNVLVINNAEKSSREVERARLQGCAVFDIGKNTGYFGRFVCSLYRKSDLVCILDDDMIPGRHCIEHYVRQCLELNAIIGGNGRAAQTNQDPLVQVPRDAGIRRAPKLVDFVGHLWVCRQEWIRNMFEIPPVTFDTGEDMHLCFSAKLNLNVPSVVGSQTRISELSDQHLNIHARSRHAGFRLPVHDSRVQVEKAFTRLGLRYVTFDEQAAFSAGLKART
jgi:hypothetical protein